MQVAEIIYGGVTVLVFTVVSAALFYGIHGAYYAYVKKKDERQKYIVLRSAAQAFGVALLYYALDAIVLFSMGDGLDKFWYQYFSIHSDTPIVFMLALFGLCLFINKRKAGGA